MSGVTKKLTDKDWNMIYVEGQIMSSRQVFLTHEKIDDAYFFYITVKQEEDIQRPYSIRYTDFLLIEGIIVEGMAYYLLDMFGFQKLFYKGCKDYYIGPNPFYAFARLEACLAKLHYMATRK